MMNEINLRCRSCNGHSIFIGTGGHLTCSYVDCKEPIVERQFAQLETENAKLKRENERLEETNKGLFGIVEIYHPGYIDGCSCPQCEKVPIYFDALAEEG